MSDGVDIFIEACRNVGTNPTLVKSLYAEYEKLYYEDIILRPQRPGMPKNAEIDARTDEQKSRHSLLLQIDDTVRQKNKSVLRLWNLETQEWEPPSILIQYRGYRPEGEQSVSVWKPVDAYVVGHTNIFIDQVQEFGRVQEISALGAILTLTRGRKDFSVFDFSEENIGQYKKEIADADGFVRFIRKGNVEYDGNQSAMCVESTMSGMVFERYWIDPSRGYVTPLMQFFDKDGNVAQEIKSSDYFLVGGTNLWYPAKYVRKFFDIPSGTVWRKEEYTFDKTTFRFNQAIADEEFAIDISRTTIVRDERETPRKTYRALENGTLSLAPNGLDLDKMDWLHKGSDMPGTTDGELYIEEYRAFLQEQERHAGGI